MQILVSLGIGVLGLASAAATLDYAAIGSSTPPPADTTLTGGAEELQIRVVQNARIWYNTKWNDILHVDGEWEEIRRGETVVLRPIDENCNIGIRPLDGRDIQYLPVDSRGEVTFEGGWIKVNQVGRSSRAAAPRQATGNATRPGPGKDDDCEWKFDIDEMAYLLIDGDCWEPVQTGDECIDYWVCSSEEGSDGCEIEFAYADIRLGELGLWNECGSGMGFSFCESAPGERWYICIWLE